MVAVATRLFAERGFADVSMDEIAAAAGITKPLLYSYFGSKEGLFAACAEEAGAGLRERLREVGERSDLPPDERLWQGLLAVFEFVGEHRRAWQLLYPPEGKPGGPLGQGADRARVAMAQLLEGLFSAAARTEGVRSDDALAHVAPMARAFTAATIAMASDWLERRDEPPELAALRLMNLAWMGFGDLLAGRLWLPGQGAS
jgi:AcrR family transcriptional regulator